MFGSYRFGARSLFIAVVFFLFIWELDRFWLMCLSCRWIVLSLSSRVCPAGEAASSCFLSFSGGLSAVPFPSSYFSSLRADSSSGFFYSGPCLFSIMLMNFGVAAVRFGPGVCDVAVGIFTARGTTPYIYSCFSGWREMGPFGAWYLFSRQGDSSRDVAAPSLASCLTTWIAFRFNLESNCDFILFRLWPFSSKALALSDISLRGFWL